MATSVGQINFGVSIDASGIAAELNRALTPALAQVQSKLDAKPLKVKIDIDTTAAVRSAQAALNRANLTAKADLDIDHAAAILRTRRALNGVNDLSIKVKIDIDNVDTAKIKDITTSLRGLRNITDKTISVKVNVNFSDADAARLKAIGPSLRALRTATDKSITVRVNVAMSDADIQKLKDIGPALRSIRGLTDKNITVKIDLQVDEAALQRVALALRELRDRNVNVRVNSNASGVDNSFKSLSGSISKVGSALGTLAKGGVALAAIAGAAGAAAGAIGGLVGALAAVGPAFAAIGATAVVGLGGVKDAFSAMSDASASAAADAQSHADAVASAQDQLTSAYDSAESAQDSLADAQDNAADAAKGVADAYKTAQERLDGYTESLQESNLDQREAALNLKEAQDELAKGGFKSYDDYQRAVLKVDRAQLNLQKSQEAGKKLQDEANDAQQKGIDQAPEVLAAKKTQADADKQVVSAQKDVQRANEAVAKAQENLTKAQNSGSSSAQKFSDAMAKLAPNAQAFVLAAQALQPALEEARKGVQDVLFQDLGDQLTQTAKVALPALEEGMKGVAGQLNGIAQGFFNFAKSDAGIQTIKDSFAGAENFIKGAREGADGFGQALSDIARVAAPQLEGIGQAFGNIGTQIAKAFSGAAADGTLDKVFSGFATTLNGLSSLLGSVISQLLDIGAKVLPALGPLFSSLGDVIKTIGPALGDIGKTFAESLTKIMPVLGPFLDALIKGLEPILPVLADLLISLGNALTPLIDPLSQVLQILGTTLAGVLDELAPAIGPLADAFVALVNALSPILPVIADLVADIVGALAPALTTIFNAFAPVIKQLAEQLKPVFDAIAPVLAQIATTLANALVDAITALAPLLPPLIEAWAGLVTSIAPLLPQLVDMAVTLIPPLVDVLKLLIPILTDVINVFTWLVNNVIIPIVEPAIEGMKENFQAMGDQIHDTVDWLQNTVFPALGKAVDTVKGWFSTAVDAIGKIWDGLKDKAAVPVNFVIDTVWNNGLLKAWGSIDNLLGGVLPDAVPLPLIPTRATGGPLNYFGSGGSGNGTKDDILFWGSNNEHVITAAEVMKAGGQNIIYAIRDMIARGIPFSWDNGKLVTDLGKNNLDAYGAAVKQKGIGKVSPEGLFDSLAKVPIPQFQAGGVIMPWMNQLKAGHDFAKAQDGKPYKWAGPQFVGDSFDCSGFMGSIIAAILGGNPWQRYWSTATFGAYPQVGAQGLVKNLTDGSGMAVGITNAPGTDGGGHTAGELRGIPELNIPAARVESGGAIGNVHYGRGTDPNSFASLYGLPIGANGFFAPAAGGSSAGPSVQDQSSFITKVIESAIKVVTDPIRNTLKAADWVPPPAIRGLPIAALDGTTHFFAEAAGHAVSGLGSLVGGVWQRAKNLGGEALNAGKSLLGHLNPFDSGGIANGTGFLAKNTIDPERVLSPEQTALFEALVQALTKIASGGLSAASQAAQAVTVDLSKASVDALRISTGVDSRKVDQTSIDTEFQKIVQQIDVDQATTAQIISDTAAETQRTQTSTAEEQQATADAQTRQLLDIAGKLSNDVLGPIFASAVGAGTDFINSLIEGLGKDVVGAVNKTTAAVNNLPGTLTDGQGNTRTPAFGEPGSAFDAITEVSTAVKTVADAATTAFNKVRDEVVAAAIKQQKSTSGDSRGVLGKDISGGFLVDFIVQLTGVEIDVRNLLENTYDEIKSFRGDAFSSTDAQGQMVSDTAALVQRTASSVELAQSEQERINKALIKAVITYLITSVLIPVIEAILGAMITLAATAVGAAIGSIIPGIGTAIGAAAGAAVGAALSGLAAAAVSLAAVGIGAALNSFDEGGVAPGLGFMPKNTIAPERVLSPRQTSAFETLVQVLDRGSSGNRTVSVGSMTVNGTGAADKSADRLLSLLNT